jgi:16S rRNA (cytidine1402-2'-O)-methyltransferase
VGIPPRKKNELQAFFTKLRSEANRRPLVLFEAPHRLVATLETALEVLGNRPVAVARELTKLYQEVRRESLSNVLAYFQENEPRGEFTIVLAPTEEQMAEPEPEEEVVVDPMVRLQELKATGIHAKAAIATVARETGLNRRQLYTAWLELD